MTRESPSRPDDPLQLRRLLRELGEASPPAIPSPAAELAREERMAASIDTELARLVSWRLKARRWGVGSLALAALVALALGLRHEPSGSVPLTISREPPTALEVRPHASAVAGVTASLPPPSSSGAKRNLPVTPSAVVAPSTVAESERGSSLAEENRMFREAAEVSRRGDVEQALRLLETLLRDHPHSPLAQTALVRKFRLLAKAGRADEARADAARYLVSYPTGFAVEEARALQQREAGDEDAAVATPTPEPGAP